MGIKVSLSDGMVEVGGEFKSALSFVKGQKGRTYDPATKTWAIPMTVKEFVGYNRTGRPLDILSSNGRGRYESGNHVTRYGTAYSRNEWDSQREIWKAEKEVAAKYAPESDEVEMAFSEAMIAIGVSKEGIRIIRAFIWDFEDVEGDRFQFSSQERRDKIFAIVEAYRKAKMDVWKRQEAEEEARTLEILERGGIL